ncbi:MAG: P-II family nitrogen regulator [Coriobacteriaceae bacterium]|jgi:nitrogen regulatory protein PII|nr:P-II family nitrogen regulator [Coriobacteriaceae bacterium]
MKEIEFIINAEKLERLKRILDSHGKTGVTIDFVMGYGHQRGLKQVYTREENPGINLLPKVSVRSVVADETVDPLIDDVVEQLGSASFGDGKIFVRDVANAIRIRTNERGDSAL